MHIKICETEFFDLFKLHEGVFAAIENEKRQAGSNAGMIDLGNFTIIFDSFFNVDAACDLRAMSLEFTGKEPSFLINSHVHLDHFIGNNIFSGETRVLSSYKIEKFMEDKGKKDLDSIKRDGSKRIEELGKMIGEEKDSKKLLDYENELLFTKNLINHEAALRPPDIVFSDAMMITGRTMTMHLKVYREAHSEEDVIAYLPESGVCFMGDLLFCKSHPWIGLGNPDRLIRALHEILGLEITTFVPGHGSLATKEDVQNQILYVRELTGLVEKNVDGEKEISIEDLSPFFRNWNGTCFHWNLNFLKEEMKKKRNGNETHL